MASRSREHVEYHKDTPESHYCRFRVPTVHLVAKRRRKLQASQHRQFLDKVDQWGENPAVAEIVIHTVVVVVSRTPIRRGMDGGVQFLGRRS